MLAIHILLHANHHDRKTIFNKKPLTIKRGQMITGRKKLSEQTGLSEQQTRTAIEVLKNTEFLTIKSTSKFSIISVCNYSKYQCINNECQPSNQPANNQQATSKQPHYKNIRIKERKEQNKNIYSREEFLDNGIPYKQIINYINKATGKSFKHTSKKTRSFIHARWEEGNRLSDFEYVIRVKTSQWKGTEYDKFLRPETLFSNKFEGYRNEKPSCKQPGIYEWLKDKGEV